MGKGDRKTAKGKRFNSSYGNVRLRASVDKLRQPAATPVAASSNKTVVKKTVLKKAAS